MALALLTQSSRAKNGKKWSGDMVSYLLTKLGIDSVNSSEETRFMDGCLCHMA